MSGPKDPQTPAITKEEQAQIVKWEKAVAQVWHDSKESREQNARAYIDQAKKLETNPEIQDIIRTETKSKEWVVWQAESIGAATRLLHGNTAQQAAETREKELDLETQKKSQENKLLTPEVQAIFDKEITAMLPELKKAGVGHRMGHKNGDVSLSDVKAIMNDGHFDVENYSNVDRNQDGVITAKEMLSGLNNVLQPLSTPARSPENQGGKKTGGRG